MDRAILLGCVALLLAACGEAGSDCRCDGAASDACVSSDAKDAADIRVDGDSGDAGDGFDAADAGDTGGGSPLASPFFVWNAAERGPYETLLTGLSDYTVHTIMAPRTAHVDPLAYNHTPLVTRWGDSLVLMFDTHEISEEWPGSFLRWTHADSLGNVWAEPATLFPSQEPMTEWDPGAPVDARILLPVGFVQHETRLYAIADVELRPYSDPNLPAGTRISLGLLAREIRGDWSLGPIVWLTGPVTPVDGFEAYESDPVLGEALLAALDTPGERPMWCYWHSTGELYAEIGLSDGTRLCERDEVQVLSSQWIRLWRDCTAASPDPRPDPPNPRVKYIQSSTDGWTWTEPIRSSIPDDPAKTVAIHLSNDHIAIVGNPAPTLAGHRRRYLYVAISDEATSDGAAQLTFSNVYTLYGDEDLGFYVAYPDAVELDTGRIGVVFSVGTSGMTFVTFTPPEP